MTRTKGSPSIACPCDHSRSRHRVRSGCRGFTTYVVGEIQSHDFDGNPVVLPDEIQAPCQCGLTPAQVRDWQLGRPLELFQPVRRRRGVPA